MATQMKKDTLNLDYHCKVLMIKALNKYSSITKTTKALGISERQLYRWMEEYKVVRVKL